MEKPVENDPDTQWPYYHPDYRFAMSGAHRKPAYEIGAPSISWRIGFWRPDAWTGAATADPSRQPGTVPLNSFEEHDAWILQIEYLILDVYDNLQRHRDDQKRDERWREPELTNLQPSRADDSGFLRLLRRKFPKLKEAREFYKGEFPYLHDRRGPMSSDAENCVTRFEAVHIDGVWESMPLDIRFEVSDEYFTITTTIDFSRICEQGERHRRRKRQHCEFNPNHKPYLDVQNALFDIITTTNSEITKIASGSTRKKDPVVSGLMTSSRYVYFGIWSWLQRDIFGNRAGDDFPHLLGSCFADFRNLSLQCSEDTASDGATKHGPSFVVNPWRRVEGEKNVVPDQNAWGDKSLRRAVMGHSFAEDDLEWVDAIHPILLSIEDDAVNDLVSDPVEYTFTKFCNERCIYGSGFGPQIEDDELPGNPLTYILLFGFDEHRQMGRLINRLHSLGTLRQAAIHDLRAIKHEYDHRLDDIERKMEKIQVLVSWVFEYAFSQKHRTKVRREERRPFWLGETHDWNEEIGTLLTEVHDGLGYLDGIRGKDRTRVEGLGWVSLRAWRSEQYLGRFESLKTALNSDFIEGYQPYDVFIEHRLARAYSVIRFVAAHYEQLREKEIRLRKEWVSLKLEHHQGEIAKAQNLAEVLFFLFLLPYYFGHNVLSVYNTHPLFARVVDHTWRKLPLMQGDPFSEGDCVLMLTFVSFLGLLIFRTKVIPTFFYNCWHAVMTFTVRLVKTVRWVYTHAGDEETGPPR